MVREPESGGYHPLEDWDEDGASQPRAGEAYSGQFTFKEEGSRRQSKPYSVKQIEDLIRLLKKGDASSLAQLRQKLGKTQREVALKVGVSQYQLEEWEKEQQQPSRTNYVQWRLNLSYYVDDVISDLLGTGNTEINTHFLEIMWGLID